MNNDRNPGVSASFTQQLTLEGRQAAVGALTGFPVW